MAKQFLVIENAKELSLSDGMIVIADKETGEVNLRPIEDVQMIIHLHSNLYVRYCATSSNAKVHKERVKQLIPSYCCDVSIIMSSDGQEQSTYHCQNRRRKNREIYNKPVMVEFF